MIDAVTSPSGEKWCAAYLGGCRGTERRNCIMPFIEAVQKNKPLFERVVTVTRIRRLPIHPISWFVWEPRSVCLIEAAGGLPENTGKIIGGGPMMGKALISAGGAGLQRKLRRFITDERGVCPQADPGLHPLRQMRRCLPDGIEPCLPDERPTVL